MKIILGITTVLLLAVFSVAYLYFSNLTVNSRSNDKTLALIPSSAAVIFQFTNDKGLYEIFKDYPVFDAITGNQKKEELTWLKEILLTNPELYINTQGQKAFLALHPLASNDVEFLWLMPLKEDLTIENAELFIKKQSGNQTKIQDYSGSRLIEIKNDSLTRSFYLSIKKGIASGSFNKELVLFSISDSSEKISTEFIKNINTSIQKDADALSNLFLNYDNSDFLKPFFKQHPYGNFGLFNQISAYSGLSLNYKSDALMFNGITTINENSKGYINLFLNQDPVKNTLERVSPYNLSNSIFYGLSNYNDFHSDLKKLFESRKELKALDDQISTLTQETGINPERDIKKLWGGQFSTLQLSTYENLAIIGISNGRQLQFFLDPLSSAYSDVVKKMNYPNLFYYYFGDPLKKFARPFYSIKDNLIIISNSPITVQRFLNDYDSDRMLYNNESFKQFEQLIADQSNISFLIHFNNSSSLLESLLKPDYSDLFKDQNYGFGNFYGFSYQLSSNKDHFFTNFYLGNKASETAKADSTVYYNDTTSLNQ